MASVHEITSVAHTLTTSDGGAWKTILPPILTGLVASIVPAVALWLNYLQSKRTVDNARTQVEEANNLARKRFALEERKQTFESRSDLYEVWNAFNNEIWTCYLLVQGDERHAQDFMNKWLAAVERIFNASLKMRFFFGDDVVVSVDSLVSSLWELNSARYAFDGPDPTGKRNHTEAAKRYNNADEATREKIDAVRDAVRLYTVPGLKKS